jgi:hypothetical protein
MPFSKYVVDPAHIEAMRVAFYRLRDVLQLSGRINDPMAEIVAAKIVDLVKAGELDPGRLCSRVLVDLGKRETGQD